MTQSFDDAWKENRHVWESTKCLAQAMYLAGHESRQIEVDELQQENNNLKSLIQGHELRHSQNLSIKKKLVARNDELQKRVDAALKKLDKRRDELWSKWKEQADMQDQGAANAFEEAYWILEQAIKGEG